MFRTDAPGNINGMYDGGDPLIPRQATIVSVEALNSFQEEIIAPIEAAGIPLDKSIRTQLRDALFALFGRLGVANTWSQPNSFTAINASGTSTLNGPTVLNGGLKVNDVSGVASISGVGATHTASGAAMPTKYIFGHTALPTASGADYPLVSLSKFNAGNVVGLNTRTVTTATVANWTNQRTMLSLDVDGVIGAGGQLQFGSTGLRAKTAANLGDATATTPVNALTLVGGYLSLDGVANPNRDVPIKNALTPRNITKVSATVQTNGTGGVQMNDGFSAASVALSGGRVVLTFAQPFASAAYQVAIGAESFPGPIQVLYRNKAAGSIEFEIFNGVGTLLNAASNPATFDVTITGGQ